MMKRCWIGVMILLLAACGGEKDKDTPQPTAEPSATSAPSIATNYTGPLLNPLSDTTDEEACKVDSDCNIFASVEIEGEALPLPLVPQNILGLSIGVPENFEFFIIGTQAIMSTLDNEQHPGNFRVTLQWLDEDGVGRLLGGYTQLDEVNRVDYQTDTLSGYTLPNGPDSELGMVGVWTAPDGRILVTEGFIDPGYWPLYAATFRTMIDSITLP